MNRIDEQRCENMCEIIYTTGGMMDGKKNERVNYFLQQHSCIVMSFYKKIKKNEDNKMR